MRLNIKFVFDSEDCEKLLSVIIEHRYEIRHDNFDLIYDCRFANQLAHNVPKYLQTESIKNLIKKLWKN
jgi:hypothetical protein